METPPAVVFSEMSQSDAQALLERNHLGRLAYSLHDRVEIEPISYVCAGEWVFMRTSPGSKIEKILRHPWVAFQVDEIRSFIDWESVVVRGSVHVIGPEAPPFEQKAHTEAVEALRQLDPQAFSAFDATPHRNRILRLHLDVVTGKKAALSAG